MSNAAQNKEPHVIAHFLRELAAGLHSYYQAGKEQSEQRWIVADKDLTDSRLCLINAVQQVLVNGLALLGISAPEKM